MRQAQPAVHLPASGPPRSPQTHRHLRGDPELLHGVETSAAPERNLALVDNVCSRLDVLPYGHEASLHYGPISAGLERRGLPIGVNHLHIAAHAYSKGLTLVTSNLCEFEWVDGLSLDNWV